MYLLQKMAKATALRRTLAISIFVTFIIIILLLYGPDLKSNPVYLVHAPSMNHTPSAPGAPSLMEVAPSSNDVASSPMGAEPSSDEVTSLATEGESSSNDIASSPTEKTLSSTIVASSPTAGAPKDDISQPLNVSVYVESFNELNAFYGDSFTRFEKDIPLSCQLPAGGTCTLHHSKESAPTSDVVFRMVRFIHPNDIVRYHEGQLLAVMNSEAERGEYGLQQLREADIKMDHHPTSDFMLAEVCSLPVQKLETSPPPDPTQRKGIAMFTSNCAAEWRSDYFKKLHGFIHIDSYGQCFHNKNEPPAPNKGVSFMKIASNYRMVVSFENLIQDDYISEKIGTVFGSGAIPVYWGPPQIYSWVPGNHSFIDASKFTPEELAKYLKGVNEEDDLFRYHTTNFDINKTKEMISKYCPKVSYMCATCQIAQKKLLAVHLEH